MTTNRQTEYSVIASYLLIGIFLLLVLKNGLLGALFAGLLMFSLIHVIAPFLGRRFSDVRARILAAAVIGSILVALLGLLAWGMVVLFRVDANSVTHLFVRLADIIDASRDQVPPWIIGHLPVDADSLREAATSWLREHASTAQAMGAEAGKTLTRVVLGMIIGLMASLHDAQKDGAPHRPFTEALMQRARVLANAFRSIVFAQVWISGINTVITALFIFVVLPLAGVNLPLGKTVVAITFLAGLLPVIGNLISNTVVVVVGLSHSLHVAMAGLAFLIVVHKLEYFLNARIIGSHINARAWELLAAMLFAEAVFGVVGVIAAPVFYAYIKDELRARELI
ncbi:putative PurR-regulated permease PerM [Pseudoduganella lurida]|uniref:Putative PurR-regulated permease PerM n=1 Tax=Pseudoduganella lurida TaxID=1036180 RepID=A0A562RKW0_9BURK|nr:AI-2E family transporter [Pseudoduganella lurida]TWI69687.1 putative PurR-regulated permease PerM [Pseudoduganella lurida]